MGQSIHPVDLVISRMASRQKGLVTWRQLLAAGISRGAIELRIRRGSLHRVFRGVYLVGHEVLPQFAREHAAVLAYEPHAFLSNRAAVGLWHLLPKRPTTMDVTVVGRNPGSQPGITVHRSRTLDRRDVTKLHDIPVTTPARTLLDFAETASEHRELERAWSEAQARSLVTPKQIEHLLERSHGRRGAKPLAELYERARTSTRSHSELEELLLALIRAAALPEPDMNVLVLGRYKVDFLWRDHRTIAEADGGGWHAGSKRRDADNRRDSELRAAGFTLERFTDHELTYAPHAAVARLTRAIYAAC